MSSFGKNNAAQLLITCFYIFSILLMIFSLSAIFNIKLSRVFKKANEIHNLNLNMPDEYDSDRVTLTKLMGVDSFRNDLSHIWKPQTEYSLNVFGRKLHLILHEDKTFIQKDNFKIHDNVNNFTAEEIYATHADCYYKGYVKNDKLSVVAVSLCNGMMGHIKTQFGSLFIEPTHKVNNNFRNLNNMELSGIVHKIWRHSHHYNRQDDYNLHSGFQEAIQNIQQKPRRIKRSTDRTAYNIDVLVAVDNSMRQYHKDQLHFYILTLMFAASKIFADESIGLPLSISVVNILVLDDFQQSRRYDILESFCTKISKSSHRYDTAMLITRDGICRNSKCGVLGVAKTGSICQRKSCSVVHDTGLGSAFTIAHELGHILNMPHDDDTRCNQFNRQSEKKLMFSSVERGYYPWAWSDCSRHYVSELLQKESSSCLRDNLPTNLRQKPNDRQPGEIYSLDHQCSLIYGDQSVHCQLENDCQILWCKANYQQMQCQTNNFPWADGSACNKKRDWCQKGKCVPRTNNARGVTINGGWSTWTPWSTCSLTCGGGIQQSSRTCNNPLPKNGGKNCQGESIKNRSCNHQRCSSNPKDTREKKCHNNVFVAKCGIEVTGRFHVSDLSKAPRINQVFYHVTTIPRGASNIVIEQAGNPDNNFIVLKDDLGRSLLNGDRLLKSGHMVINYAGVTFDYNGANQRIERVKTLNGKKLNRDLKVEIISLNHSKENDLLLTYSYTRKKR